MNTDKHRWIFGSSSVFICVHLWLKWRTMFYDELKYDANGLVCGVFQDYQSGEVLTVAWLNKEAVQQMWETKHGTVYRRSKGRVMMKGEVSGNVQIVHAMFADCDRDALVI